MSRTVGRLSHHDLPLLSFDYISRRHTHQNSDQNIFILIRMNTLISFMTMASQKSSQMLESVDKIGRGLRIAVVISDACTVV